ncbi:MAG: hypothetical protein F2892_08435 [Actinobacteria bacterium]|uniref:Unannotated protein n=1 Tax=freshwater metagenome TaxID=449393 RepID=A0A6J7RBA4_9ZZZZ|nr:hypothetical protein [Actinomycetota bacterium]
MRVIRFALIGLPLALALLVASPASAIEPGTQPADGTFIFKTGNGILPTWNSESLRLTGVSPGSAITNATATSATVTLPIVAKKGSANFAAGGFRITNTETGAFVNCATPAIDTRARVIDCVLRGGTNLPLFAFESIEGRSFGLIGDTVSADYTGMVIKVAGQRAADFLNKELGTNAFSPYVTVATADLSVTYPRS